MQKKIKSLIKYYTNNQGYLRITIYPKANALADKISKAIGNFGFREISREAWEAGRKKGEKAKRKIIS